MLLIKLLYYSTTVSRTMIPQTFSHVNLIFWIFHSRGQQPCTLIGTKASVNVRQEFNSDRIGLNHQHGCHFIVLGQQYGRHDVM